MADQHFHIQIGSCGNLSPGAAKALGTYLVGFWPFHPYPPQAANQIPLEGWIRPVPYPNNSVYMRVWDMNGNQVNGDLTINVTKPTGRFTHTFPAAFFQPNSHYFLVVYEDAEHSTELGGCSFRTS